MERYAAEGVLSVEMEVASPFAAADYPGVDAAAVLEIGDHVTVDERDVSAAGGTLLPTPFEPTVAALRIHLQ